MSSFSFDSIATQFYNAGIRYSSGIQPYALKLFFALFLIEIIVTWLQYTAEGHLDPSYYLGRTIKHILTGGFVYLMIVNAFTWMNAVINSFSNIGAAVTGLPALSPDTVLQLGGNMAETLFSTPATASMTTNIELAIVQSICGFVVLFAFAVTAADLLLTLVEMYLVVGGGVILLGFGGNRYTAAAAEGYFSHVLRVGVRLLFFYLVLAIGVQLANQWSAALNAACKPTATALPWWTTYGVPPSSIMTTVCSGSLSASDMFEYAVLAVVFLILCMGVPRIAAGLVGGTVGLALNHAFEAAYTAQAITRIVHPITSALKSGFNQIAQFGNETSGGAQAWVSSLPNLSATATSRASSDTQQKPTQPLNPRAGGHQPRWSPGGPSLPPPPSNGSGGAALEHHLQKAGDKTRQLGITTDFTRLDENGGDSGSS